jgi:hypothetical protein
LDDPSLRDICLDSLFDCTQEPIPSIDYFDKIYAPVAERFSTEPAEQEVPFDSQSFTDDQIRRLIAILGQMCRTSRDAIKHDRGEETIDLAIAIVEQSVSVANQRSARTMLEAIDPTTLDSGYVEHLWDLTIKYLRQSYEGSKDHKRDAATNLFSLLTEQWATEQILNQMEADIYEELKRDPGPDYRDHLKEWHEECR